MKNKTLLVSYTDAGKEKMEELAQILRETGREAVCLDRPKGGDFLNGYWQQVKEILFISAAGIAVRLCAPYIRDKFQDPAVVVMDEKGQFAVPILSGHVGGANELARLLAGKTGAIPVITTATDVNNRFAVDVFAAKCGLVLKDRIKAKEISAAVLKGRKVGFYSEFPLHGKVPEELEIVQRREDLEKFDTGILIQEKPGKEEPKDHILALFPRLLTAGMGCKRGISEMQLEDFLKKKLADAGYDPRQIGCLASIDRKADEPGLVQLAARYHVPFKTWPSQELEKVKEVSCESAFVEETVGVGNVCERAAVLGSRGGRLVMGKTAEKGMTLALAAEDWSVDFDKIICDRPGTGQL